MMSCSTGNPAHHPAPVERLQKPNGPEERQRGPPETSPAFSGGPQPHPFPRSGKSHPAQGQTALNHPTRGQGSRKQRGIRGLPHRQRSTPWQILVHCCQTRWWTDIRRGPQHRLCYRLRSQQGLVPSWTPLLA